MDMSCDEEMESETETKKPCFETFDIDRFFELEDEPKDVILQPYALGKLFTNGLFRNVLKLIIDYLKISNEQLEMYYAYLERINTLNSHVASNQEVDAYDTLVSFFKMPQINKYMNDFIRTEYFHSYKFKINDPYYSR